MTNEQGLVERCVKPGCGAQRIVGKPCRDWDCPQQTVHHSDHRAALEAQSAQIAELQASLDESPDGSGAWRFWSRKAAEMAQKNADLKRALDTARHDAREVIRLWAIDRHGRDLSWRNHMDAAVSALQTKDQSHGA